MNGKFHVLLLQEAAGHQADIANHWLYNEPEAAGGCQVAFKSDNFHEPEWWHVSITNPYESTKAHKETLEICIGRARFTRLPPEPTGPTLTVASLHLHHDIAKRKGCAEPMLQTAANIMDLYRVAFVGCDLNMAAFNPTLCNIFPGSYHP